MGFTAEAGEARQGVRYSGIKEILQVDILLSASSVLMFSDALRYVTIVTIIGEG